MLRSPTRICIVGFGAITQGVFSYLPKHVQVDYVLVRAEKVAACQAALPSGVQAVSQVPQDTTHLLECAGHSAIHDHVLPALHQGVVCAILSIGALSEHGLPEQLTAAAQAGHTQVHLLSGAMGAIDALAGASFAGLNEVRYTGRKPPTGWLGSPAQEQFDLLSLSQPTVILQASARVAAQLYPKNANVAATLSLAGLGFEATQVTLIADPSVTDNVHQVYASGAFGSFTLEMRGKPLPTNPKTSMLTVLSAVRFLSNLTHPTVL